MYKYHNINIKNNIKGLSLKIEQKYRHRLNNIHKNNNKKIKKTQLNLTS